MPNDNYDIAKAFKVIENDLIASMIRNLKHHRAEEEKEGKEWTQWQVEQLQALEKYKKENAEKYNKQFKSINAQIGEMIRAAKEAGSSEQEIAILNAIKNGFKATKKSRKELTGEFFKLNERKLDALIKATTDDMKKAETAILRMANDKYRKIIFNAQVYANTGAGTYEKAVDMATRDMLNAGLNCVQYANKARHTLSDYADMAIRTANKRAYLQGEGEKRQEWGISTVIMNKRGNACPKCLPFVGKVMIDDVWSGGKKTDGAYLLMSNAIAQGLYHPRCKDSHTTYFPGISTPGAAYTKAELEQIESDYKEEQKEQYARRQAERFERLANYSLDKDNQKKYAARAEEWKQQAEEIKSVKKSTISDFVQANTIEEAELYAKKFCNDGFMAKTFKGKIEYKGISIEHANAINKALTEVYNRIELDQISGIKVISPTSALGKKAFKDGADAVFSYSPIEHGIFVNKEILKNTKAFSEYVKDSDEAWELVMKNIDTLSGTQKELALTYKKAGRSLVDGNTVEGLVKHELGHHVQWTLLDATTNNKIGSNMSKFAPQISGYANASKSEYLAESFAAYLKGEINILDNEYVEAIEKKTIAKDRLGIFTNNNKSNPKYYDFENKSIVAVENEISKLDYEVGVIFKDGKAINCQLGIEDEVDFTRHQLKLMKGNDVTHNHPLSTPPSPEDLYLLVQYKAKSFRTCGKCGTYVLEYTKDIEKLPDFETFSESYDNLLHQLQPKYYEKVKKGMNENDAIIALGEEIWEELYKIYSVKPVYERR